MLPSLRESLCPINLVAGGLKLSEQLGFPGTSIIHLGIHDASKVSGNLDVAFFEGTHAIAPQLACKPEHFTDDILACPGLEMFRIGSPDVIRRQHHNGKSCRSAVRLKFLDDGATGTRLFV